MPTPDLRRLRSTIERVASLETRMTWATAAALPACTRVGNILTANANGALTGHGSADGVTVAVGDKVLVKNQVTGANNGPYVVLAIGVNGVSPWIMERLYPFNKAGRLKSAMLFTVSKGTANGGKAFQLTTADPITINTTAQAYGEVAAASAALALQVLLASIVNGEGASLIGIEDAATLYTAATVEAALAEARVLINTNTAAILQKREVTVGHADLTQAANGTAQSINLGAILPANAVVIGTEVNIATLFSGGGATAVKLDIGGTDDDAIAAQHDVFTGAATGALTPTPVGVHARGKFSAQQLALKFTPDAGHALLGLDAGSLTATVWFHVLA